MIQTLPKVLHVQAIRATTYHTASEYHILLLVKMKEKKLLKIQPLPKVLRVQAILWKVKKCIIGQNEREENYSRYKRFQKCCLRKL